MASFLQTSREAIPRPNAARMAAVRPVPPFPPYPISSSPTSISPPIKITPTPTFTILVAAAIPPRAPYRLCVATTPSWTLVGSSGLRPSCSIHHRNWAAATRRNPPLVEEGSMVVSRERNLRLEGPRGAIKLRKDCLGERPAGDGSKPGETTRA